MDLMSVRVELMLPTYLLEYKAPSHFPVAPLILKKPPRVNRLWQLTRNTHLLVIVCRNGQQFAANGHPCRQGRSNSN
jgi:hypothetical protein